MSVLGTTEYRRKVESEDKVSRLATVLRRLRSARGWSGRRLAKMAGVPASSINHYENGLTILRRDVLQKIGDAMDVPAELLAWFAYAEADPRKRSRTFVLDVDKVMMDQVDVFVQGAGEERRATVAGGRRREGRVKPFPCPFRLVPMRSEILLK